MAVLSINASAPYSSRQRPAMKAETLKRKLSQSIGTNVDSYRRQIIAGGLQRPLGESFCIMELFEGSSLTSLRLLILPVVSLLAIQKRCHRQGGKFYFDGNNVPPFLLLVVPVLVTILSLFTRGI